MTDSRRFLGEILMDMGCVTEENINRALERQMNGDARKIGEIFVDEGLCADSDITAALAEQFNMEMVDLEGWDIAKEALSMLSEQHCAENHVMPVDFFDGVLTLAISDPLDLQAIDNIRFMIGCQVEPVLASKNSINAAIDLWYRKSTAGLKNEMDKSFGDEATQDDPTEGVLIQRAGDEYDAPAQPGDEDAPIIKLVHLIIQEAVKNRASDIHVEPMGDRLRVRYRIDGVCYEVDAPQKRLQSAILSRLKIMAKMHVEEKRRPQDGKIPLRMLGRELDLRVSSLPTNHGESIVMRILDRAAVSFTLEDMGFWHEDLRAFNSLIKKPNGIVLITGPTGSGKTTTLYSVLNELNGPECKIITAENPVEYTISGLNQCQINPDTGMTFQKALRAMLRQAPNVILVGEIRDKETSEIAIQAALTGHLVFSTLHTNDAPSALTRLIDMGVPPFLVASSIQAVMAQRLVRTICKDCKTPTQIDPMRFRMIGLREEQFAGRTFYHGVGCPACNHIGFRGRKGIFEIMLMNPRIREMCFNKATTDALREQAIRDGMHTLLQDGIRKVMDGWTTLDEIMAEAKQYA